MNAIPETDTRVREETSGPETKARPTLLVLAGGLVVLFAGVLVILFALDDAAPAAAPSRDQLAQQAYDEKQQDKARRKAESLADQPYVDRGSSSTSPTAELEKLLAKPRLEAEPAWPAEEPAAPAGDHARRVSLVEQMLARRQADGRRAAWTGDARAENLSARKYADERREKEQARQRQPMFVYSHSLRQAEYYAGGEKTAAAPSPAFAGWTEPPPAESSPPPVPAASPATESADKAISTLLFGPLPPVRVAEGEFIDSLLVHRLVADVEESPVVAVVSRDLIDDSGRFVVVPAGSRLVGRSRVVNYMGAARLFIDLRRLILPNGAAAEFPGARRALAALDATGALGVASHVNRHWWLQFGTAVFVGVLQGLGSAAQRHTDPYSTRAYMIEGTTDNFERILNTIMQRYTTIVPTITVSPGHPMKVFLTEDILISPWARVAERSYARR